MDSASLLTALRAQWQRDSSATSTDRPERGENALFAAFKAVGWEDPESAAVSVPAAAPNLIEACVNGHGNVDDLVHELADMMRFNAYDGADSPSDVAPFVPIARQAMEHYVTRRA